jgi:hypothetical protein
VIEPKYTRYGVGKLLVLAIQFYNQDNPDKPIAGGPVARSLVNVFEYLDEHQDMDKELQDQTGQLQ